MPNQLITQYRNHADRNKDDAWKDSRHAWDFADVCLVNKIVGYEKYRQVVR